MARDPFHQFGEFQSPFCMYISFPVNALPGITRKLSESILLLHKQNV